MPSQVAAALYRAHKGKFTGHLNLTAGALTSQLSVVEGDVVGARLGFGQERQRDDMAVAETADA